MSLIPEWLERYSRQIVLPEMGSEGQKKLSESSVFIIGCGALGSAAAQLLTRAGIGKIRVVDRDFVELSNLQRQIIYDEGDVKSGYPKAIVCAEKLRKINSSIEVEAIVDDVNPQNIEKLIEGFDLIIDGLDNFETRFLINDAALKQEIPWIYAAAISTHGMTMNIIPGETACLRDLIDTPPPPGSLPTCETAGILNSVPTAIASIEVTEAIKILLGKDFKKNEALFWDLWNGDILKIRVSRREDCPACVRGEYEFLAGKGSKTVTLCGANAVQVRPDKRANLNLKSLGERLQRIGRVRLTPYVLYFDIDSYEISIFPDGRAIIKGTTDENIARSLYSKYIGI
ncbi:MAG TPA: NAD(P)H-binding protein [Candidatus Korarchaeota archaeon]|nr:NAD(P)H-binding protein [Candidatus Korarchaeota archaeon]